ncbi:MAG TPA: tetratricopeptide repeat protein [Gaiellaceae bacterium]|jgi:tetratricopeptide (TPR) repeat protein
MDDRLRQVAIDRAPVEAALAEAERRLAVGETAQLRQYAGQAARLLCRNDPAIEHLSRAFELEPSPPARIRLGEAYRCADRLGEALTTLTEALAESRQTPFEDFALQHLGKALTDAGRADEAVDTLERALALRREKGDPALVESSERALERAPALLRQP